MIRHQTGHGILAPRIPACGRLGKIGGLRPAWATWQVLSHTTQDTQSNSVKKEGQTDILSDRKKREAGLILILTEANLKPF